MKLATYTSQKRGRASAIARAIGVNPVMVSQWVKGIKAVPLSRAVQIESATAGAVTRKDLFPDSWREFWPELSEDQP